MKAISLLQPWATLIMLGYKQFETRSWATKHRGPLAIAASAGKPVWARAVCETDPIISALLKHNKLSFDTLPRGVVVGLCQVDEVHTVEQVLAKLNQAEIACGDYSSGRYAWALSHVQAFATPIPCKGALSLWQVPAEVEEQFPLSSAPVPSLERMKAHAPAIVHARPQDLV